MKRIQIGKGSSYHLDIGAEAWVMLGQRQSEEEAGDISVWILGVDTPQVTLFSLGASQEFHNLVKWWCTPNIYHSAVLREGRLYHYFVWYILYLETSYLSRNLKDQYFNEHEGTFNVVVLSIFAMLCLMAANFAVHFSAVALHNKEFSDFLLGVSTV